MGVLVTLHHRIGRSVTRDPLIIQAIFLFLSVTDFFIHYSRYMQTGTGFNPMCDENGHYYPVQCETKSYSSSSQTYEECFCVDIWDGARTLGSNEIIFGSGADEKKLAMENKCAPPFGYLQEIENRKKTSEWNQNFESKSDQSIAPCTKKYNDIEAANKLIAEKNTVYTSFGKIVSAQLTIIT